MELDLGVKYHQAYLADGVARLSISSPSKADSGRYTCRAESGDWFDQVSYDFSFTSKEDYIRQKIKDRTSQKDIREFSKAPSASSSSLTGSSYTTTRRPHFAGVLTDATVPYGGFMALQVRKQYDKATKAVSYWQCSGGS